MSKTKQLLEKISSAIRSGQLPLESIPIDDIKNSVRYEIELYRNTMTYEQYMCITNSFNKLCSNISEDESDVSKILLLLDALILCIDMLSDVIYTLANKEYWEYKHFPELDDPEIQKVIEYIDKKQRISLLNYDFVDEYSALQVEVLFDMNCQMFYVPYKGRKMYFPKDWDEEKVIHYYRSVVAEQDKRSPHCYTHADYEISHGDVVVDVGAAEGIFALDIIDMAKKVYLIEADQEWVEALQQTFKDDSEKVKIIRGFADCVAEGERITLDSLLMEEVNYIKMDIEGYEKPALLGAKRLLQESNQIKCAICAYHCKEDEIWIKDFLKEQGFVTDVSNGYICPDWTVEAYIDAELRRGIVFGRK